MTLLEQKQKSGAVGFPQIVSKMESEDQAEILMVALGPSLKKLVKQCPGETLSLQSVYKLTIQIVSIHLYLSFNRFKD